MTIHLVVVALADKDEPECVPVHIVNDPAFSDVASQKGVSSQFLRVMRPRVIEQGEYLFYDLPELFGRLTIQKLLRFLANEES